MRIVTALAILALVPLVAGCTFTQGAGGQEGVLNEKDRFLYGVQGTKSGTETYTWENSKSSATVDLGVQGSGSVRVVLKDAAGKTVLDRNLALQGQGATQATSSAGTAGQWTITLTFNSLSGQGGLSINAR